MALPCASRSLPLTPAMKVSLLLATLLTASVSVAQTAATTPAVQPAGKPTETEPAATSASAPPSSATAPSGATATVALAKVEVVSDRLSGAGNVIIDRDEINRHTLANGDLNKLLQTVPNIQFGTNEGRLGNPSLVDLRPSLISIAGGRPYDNNFQIDGLGTNSVQDSTNQNIHATDEIVGHPQTAVLNPALVESVEVFTSDVPAEYGGFTGGVVSARLRDPSGRMGGGLSLGYATSNWAKQLIAPENVSAANPAPPRFHRESASVYTDLPLGAATAALVSLSRNTATLENTKRYASYGVIEAKTFTRSDNILAKVSRRVSDQLTLRLTSMWSPYSTENREQDLKISHNDSWSTKAELSRKVGRSSLEASVAFQWADNSREAPPDIYTYKNFGSGYKVNWVTPEQTVGILGGIGTLNSSQRDVPVAAKFALKVGDTAELAVGGDYALTEARRERPQDSSAYRHQTTVGVNPNLLVVSGDGPNDLTVIAGEQALNYRLLSPAYRAKVQMQSADAWLQWSDRGRVWGLPWTYRAGGRLDYNDFLANSDFAPRFLATLAPWRPLTLRFGASRYYSRALVAYKIREYYPDSITYTRTGRSENGKLVFYAKDWVPSARTTSTRYSNGGLDTPYSDELSLSGTVNLGRFGAADLSGLERRNRDEFSRSASSVSTVNGVRVTSYRITNEGFTNYRSASFEWRKDWRNHRFKVGSTWSKTVTSTVSYLDEYQEDVQAQPVSYNGRLVTRSDVSLVRANFARPTYLNYSWASTWCDNRLGVDVFGRWNAAYTRPQVSGTVLISGTKYDNYIDKEFGETLITDLNLSWMAWRGRRGALTLELKVANVLNRLPHAEGTTPADPYQEGRSCWAGLRFAY